MPSHPPSAVSAATTLYLVNAPRKTVFLITAQKDKKCANNHSIYLPNATLLNTVTSLRTQRQKISLLFIDPIHLLQQIVHTCQWLHVHILLRHLTDLEINRTLRDPSFQHEQRTTPPHLSMSNQNRLAYLILIDNSVTPCSIIYHLLHHYILRYSASHLSSLDQSFYPTLFSLYTSHLVFLTLARRGAILSLASYTTNYRLLQLLLANLLNVLNGSVILEIPLTVSFLDSNGYDHVHTVWYSVLDVLSHDIIIGPIDLIGPPWHIATANQLGDQLDTITSQVLNTSMTTHTPPIIRDALFLDQQHLC